MHFDVKTRPTPEQTPAAWPDQSFGSAVTNGHAQAPADAGRAAANDADTTESALGEVSKSVQVGRKSLLAQVVEQSPEVLDTAMARLGGTVLRRPVYEIEDEIARAQEAQRDAKQQANAKLREARHEKTRAQAHAQVEELKSKLHLERKPATTGS
jgi:hypothetical protein